MAEEKQALALESNDLLILKAQRAQSELQKRFAYAMRQGLWNYTLRRIAEDGMERAAIEALVGTLRGLEPGTDALKIAAYPTVKRMAEEAFRAALNEVARERGLEEFAG